MQGTVIRAELAAVGFGIIPARAGSSLSAAESSRRARGHPRVCGEQSLSSNKNLQVQGSSPRVRGADPLALVCVPQDGIIPACAGSSRCSPPRASCWGDHPRACGEQRRSWMVLMSNPGSSPRVRGAGPSPITLGATCGIIPARAGSSRACGRGATGSWDHPRACGEQDEPNIVSCYPKGSSPRVRGAGQGRRLRHGAGGIIPARAGSSLTKQCKVSATRDHPRACGEQASATTVTTSFTGSSPRVRGAVTVRAALVSGSGIIPARAGSSARSQGRRVPRRDHPRACGEQTPRCAKSAAMAGSSPRVRGADFLGGVSAKDNGIIPARAGSSFHR